MSKSILNMFLRREYFKETVCVTILLTVILIIFGQSVGFDFINYDDYTYITGNHKFNDGITLENIKWAFTTTYFGFYYPITWLSHMIDVRFYGSDAGGHHMTSVVIHIFNSILLLYLLNLLTGAYWRSYLVALLFAIHPLHVESVVWIAERKDLLSTFFLFAALISYFYYIKRHSILKYVLTLFFFLLSLISKSMFVTTPFIMLILDFWHLNRIKNDCSPLFKTITNNFKTVLILIVEKIPFIVLSIVFSFITYFLQVDISAISSLKAITITTRMANIFLSYSNYVISTLFPLNLSIIYRYEWHSLLDLKVILSTALLILITYLSLKNWNRCPYLITGWLLYLIVLIPVIGIVQVGLWSRADHYTYVSIIGLFIISVWGLNDLSKNLYFRKTILSILIVVIFPVIIYLSYLQTSCWRDTLTLFTQARLIDKNNYIAYSIIGNEYLLKEKLSMAYPYLMECFRIDPSYEQVYPHICGYFVASGKIDEGIQFFKNILSQKKDSAMANYCLGSLYLSKRGYNDSLSYCLNALDGNSKELRNKKANLLAMIGYLYLRLGNEDKGIYYLNSAIKDEPQNGSSYYYLSYFYALKGRKEKANYYFKKAKDIGIDSLNKEVELNMIRILLNGNKRKDIKRALNIALTDCQKTHYSNPHFLAILSECYQKLGDSRNAIEIGKKAMQFASLSKNRNLIIEIKTNLKKGGIEF